MSFSLKKTSKPIAFGSAILTFSMILAKTDLFQGNWPNFFRLFSSISIMTTSEDSFFNGKIFLQSDIFLAIIPLGSILFFQFISAPSSDIPVFLISFLLFYLLLKHWGNISKEIFTIIYLLSF